MGTPKSLELAIFNAFETLNKTTTHEMVEEIKLHVKDYLAQKFSIAHMSGGEECAVVLTNLYNSIVSSPKGKEPIG